MKTPLPSGPCGCVQLRVPSVTGSVPIVRAVVQKVLENCRALEDEAAAVVLAVAEAVANVIEHGYRRSPDGVIDIGVEMRRESGDSTLVVEIRHYGEQVDPAVICGRDLTDVRPGGLGVHIMARVMDRIEHAIIPEGGMRTRLTKRLSATQTQEGRAHGG